MIDLGGEMVDPDEWPTVYLRGKPIIVKHEDGTWLNYHPGEPPEGPAFLSALKPKDEA